jgi:urea transport system ATP-binding protein
LAADALHPLPLAGEGRGEGASPAATLAPTLSRTREREQGAPLLKIDGLNQYYGGSHILRNVALEAVAGEVTVILGRNGVGKTTLLKSLMGVVPVRSGTVRFGDADITHDTPYQRVRRGIGYVPQGREIFSRLTVEENLQMGLAYKSGRTQLPKELFELFPVLKQMLHRRGGDLSGGQQQQLAIARALAAGPSLLVLDEPTEGIQPSIIKDIGRVIRMLADTGLAVDGKPQRMAIVLVEQYYDFAAELADRYLVMERGEVIQQGLGADMEAEGVRARMSI